MSLHHINDYILQYQQNASEALFIDRHLSALEACTKLSPVKRSRILLHETINDSIQKMVINFEAESHIELVSHTFYETFICIQGAGRYFLFKNDYEHSRSDLILGNYNSDRVFLAVIPQYHLHRFVPISRITAYELTHSHFCKEFTIESNSKYARKFSQVSNKEILLQPIIYCTPSQFYEVDEDVFAPLSEPVFMTRAIMSSLPSVNIKLQLHQEASPLYNSEYILRLSLGSKIVLQDCSVFVIDGMISTSLQIFTPVNTSSMYINSKYSFEIISCSTVLIIHVVHG